MYFLLRPNLYIFLIIFFIPAVNLTVRLSLDLILFLLIFLFSNLRINKNFLFIIFPIFICLMLQDMQYGSINNLLEIGRFAPIISTIILLKYFRGINDYEYLFLLLLGVNFIFCLLNYLFLSEWMVNNGFNLISFENAYGRNSGAVASFTVLALLSFINIFIGLTTKTFAFRISCLTFGLICLLITGSKTLIAVSFFYIFLYFFRNSLNFFLNPIRGIFIVSFIIITISFISNLVLSEQFQVLYQLERLIYFIQFFELGSVDARFFIWETYFSSQMQNPAFLLFGTPKELLQQFTGTFDSDFVFYFIRLGILIFSAIIGIYIYFLNMLYRKKAFSEFYFLGLVIMASFFIGIATDIQASILLCLLLMYFGERIKT